MNVPFEPTKSFCYRFARFQALPEILTRPEFANGASVKLVELVKIIADKYLTKEQQAVMLKKAQSDRQDSVIKTIKHYVPFIAKNTGQLTLVGNGMFRLPTEDDFSEQEIDDEALDEGDEESEEFDGSIYAFSFPAIVKVGESFPIKVGKTTGDVKARVDNQCRNSATFENPVILGSWPVKRVGAVEAAIHKVLQSRGKWRENVPGQEWFNTTLEEIQSIVTFVIN